MYFLKERKKLIIPVLSLCMMVSALCLGKNPVQAYAQMRGINAGSPTQEEIRKYASDHNVMLDAKLEFQKDPVLTAPYKAGSLSETTQNAALNMLNQIRYIAGISADVELDPSYSELAQAASVVNYVNKKLSHDNLSRPEGMDETLFEAAVLGAMKCNLASTTMTGRSLNRTIVKSWMKDSDADNIKQLGHRRCLLNPGMKKTGFGAVTGTNGTYSSVYILDGSRTGTEYVAWPAQNMPVEYFDKDSAWSLSLGKSISDKTVKVTLTKKGSGQKTQQSWIFSNDTSADSPDGDFYLDDDSYGQTGCIIFRPQNMDGYQDGDTYEVQVDVSGSTGETESISYTVNFFQLGTAIDTDPGPGTPDTEKKLESISAEYTGEPLTVGSTVNKSDILVKAKYSDNSEIQVADFTMEPDPCIIQDGTNTITIRYGDKTASVKINGASTGTNTITLRFDTRGGTKVEPVTIDKDTSLNPLPETTREGYVFDGWYTAIEGGTKVTEETKFSENTALYARWAENTITELKAEFLGKYLMAGTKEWIDKKDLRVTAVYLNGATEEITTYSLDDYTIAEGENVLTVHYGGQSAQITVLGVAVKDIGIIYQGGVKPIGTNKLEDVDIIVIAELTNGDSIYKVTSYTIDPFVIQYGRNMLTVRLGDKNVSFNVIGQDGVTSASSVSRITAQYNGSVIRTGSFVNRSDITVTAYFVDGTSRTVTDFTIDTYRILSGNNTLTVRYGGQSASITVIGDDTNGRVTYQVFFDSQGGTSVEPMVVQAQDMILTVPTPSKSGAVFQGWYTMKNGGGTKLTPLTRITNNSFYYAYWSDKTMTGISAYFNGQAYAGMDVSAGLVVNANYADGTSERIENYTVSKRLLTAGSNPITVTHGQFTTNIDIMAVQGNPSGGNPSGGNTNDTSNGNQSSGTSSGNQGQTSSRYVINFHANGGTNLSSNKQIVEAGDMIDFLPEVERKNYTFKGWYTSYTGGEKVSDTMVPDASATLYARWSKVKKPAKSAVHTLTSKKKGQISVKCKKVSGADGYQIGYSTKKDFSSSVKKVTGTSANRTIKNLKKGKKYYVRVRAYKIDSAGNKVYGAYSSKKTIKVKK